MEKWPIWMGWIIVEIELIDKTLNDDLRFIKKRYLGNFTLMAIRKPRRNSMWVWMLHILYFWSIWSIFYVWVIGLIFLLNNKEARQWNSLLNYDMCKSGEEHPWVCRNTEHS
jgi:hypothetical protein